MVTYVPDNLWGEMLPSIDNAQLMENCLEVEDFLLKEIVTGVEVDYHGSKTTNAYRQYSLLSFPIKSFQDLYHNIVTVIKPLLPKETHVLQCWLNVFRDNEYIDWHGHWPPEMRAIHGFYCVNVTPSFTEYKFKHIPGKVFKVDSKEGLMVFGKSNNDLHRSSPWNNNSEPRVTIAFDIIPLSTMNEDQLAFNHFLPF